jgi:RNA polymerase sigma factor (sigma-70 family)
MPKQPLGTAAEPTDPATWVDRHGDYLFRYALARLRQANLAEDLVQEAFLGALQGRDQFAGVSSERTWLVSILKRKIIDHLRRHHQEQPLSDIAPDGWMDELFNKCGHWKKSQPSGPAPAPLAKTPSSGTPSPIAWASFPVGWPRPSHSGR